MTRWNAEIQKINAETAALNAETAAIEARTASAWANIAFTQAQTDALRALTPLMVEALRVDPSSANALAALRLVLADGTTLPSRGKDNS